MKLLKLDANHYRSLRKQTILLNDFNLFIGGNASGKSTILDALRFLSEAVQTRGFRDPVFTRGGLLHLAWKGEPAQQIGLTVQLDDDGRSFEWSVRLVRNGYEFYADEHVTELRPDEPPISLLEATRGEGWWWSGKDGKVQLKQAPTSCALSAAAADASFRARDVAEFIGRWGFCDPSPFLLRRDWTGLDSAGFDHYGRNLAGTLYALQQSCPKTLTAHRGSDTDHCRRTLSGNASSIGGPLLLCAGRAGPPLPSAPDGSIQRNVAHVGPDDGAARRGRDESDRYRGTRELHPSDGIVCFPRSSSACAGARPVSPNDTLPAAP